ncbi:MAG TPA: TIGR03545 family protein [Gemmatimonadales bacterium]|nr:TIGR03545 family protein [Gemmatimonadales bacterium]
MRIKIFRWKAIGPLLLLLVAIGVLVVLFAEPVARSTTEEASTELLGTEVDVGRLDLLPRQASVDLGELQVADPFEPRRNLVEADRIILKLNPEALAEKKLVVERFTLQGMRFGTTRKRPARPVSGDGFAPQALRAVRAWGQQFDVPILQLTPIDTIKQLVLNPSQLGTVQAAQGLLARTDSTRQALEQGFAAVDVHGTVDSARALADRLSKTDPRQLGLDGTRQAIQSVQQTLKQLDAAKQQVQGLERNVTAGVKLLGAGVTNLDEARKRDYAFARSLLKLPTFSAPDIGNAFFGKVSIDRFQQALYWAELARHYMPPGLLPREDPGPKRLRASGTTVRFPKEKTWPSFLLQLGQVDFTIADGLLKGAYAATVQGVTSAPALYGKPMTVTAKRSAPGSVIAGLDIGAVVDHRTASVRDSVSARLRGVKLPSFDIPGLPFRIAPGTGAANLNFALRGDQLLGRWSIGSDQVAWALDTAGGKSSDLQQLVWRVVSGLKQLNLDARVSGTIKAPRLSVKSNLDDAIAQRLKAVVGEEVAKAEALARAKVDSIVSDKVEPVKQRIAALQADATKRVAAEQARLDQVEADLQAQLKRLTGGLAPGINLPKIKL